MSAQAGATVRVWMTTADQTRLLTETAPAAFAPGSAGVPLPIAVADDQQFQRIAGFGASITESSAWLLQTQLASSARDAAMAQLFSPTTGIGLSVLRQPIGASDFSLSHYSYDDVPFGQSDFALAQFSIARDKTYVIPTLKQALALNPLITVIASPWSPPGWMKTSGTLIGGRLRADVHTVFASYLVRFVQAYQAEGVPIQSLTLQNEPHAVPDDYPGMYMDAPEQASLLANDVGPALARAGLPTTVLLFDHNWNEPDYPASILQDPAAAAYASGTAFHCYSGQPDAMTPLHDSFPDKSVQLTECSSGAWSAITFATGLYEGVRLVIRATRNWAESVVKWNVALDEHSGPHTGGCTTCSGVITIDSGTHAVTQTADFYALGHASKFVVPGARRIASTTYQANALETVAFLNPDGTRVLVVSNFGGARRIEVQWNGEAFTYDLPDSSAATFVWAGAGGVTPPPPPATQPYHGTPAAIPGRIEAEEFDLGAEGAAYHDLSPENSGGQFRATGVDIEATTDVGGGYDVGWMAPGEWLAYSVNVAAAGAYTLDARVAANGAGGMLHVEANGKDVTGALTIPNTGGWQSWTTLSHAVSLTAGAQSLRVVVDGAGPTGVVGNLNWIRLTAVSTSPPPPATQPYRGTPAAIPGRIEAEEFDLGAEGAAYHDLTPENSGGQFRATGVDIQSTTDVGGGYNVGWIAPGEWLAYSVTVATAGAYTLEARVAANGVGGTFHLEVAGQNLTGPIAIPDTGSWQGWTSVTKPVVLSAGPQVIRVVIDGAGPTGVVGNLNYLSFSR